jgi:aquaporin Z
MTTLLRQVIAEFVGTAILVFFAVGSAVFGLDTIGAWGVALAFGFVLLALAYSIGPISGCHVNPAVTLGVLLRRGITAAEAGAYVVAQLLGAIVGAALIKLVLGVGDVTDQTGALGTNGWGPDAGIKNAGGTFLLEVILTFLLVLVVLQVTHRSAAPGFAGLAIGLVLTVIHLVGIPLDGTSVNPARSIGPAIFEGGTALSQLWVFIVAPLVGALLAALVHPLLSLPANRVDPGDRSASADRTGADLPPTR